MMLDLVYVLNAVAWPAAVSFCVYRITLVLRAYLAEMTAQYADTSVTQANAAAAKALRAAEKAQQSLDTHREWATEELGVLKSALIDR